MEAESPREPQERQPLTHMELFRVLRSILDPGIAFDGAKPIAAVIADLSEGGIIDTLSMGDLLAFFVERNDVCIIQNHSFISLTGLLIASIEYPERTNAAEADARAQFPNTMDFIHRINGPQGVAMTGCIIDAIGALRRKTPAATISLRRDTDPSHLDSTGDIHE